MNIETKYHGELDINKQDILRFDDGIPGFLEEKAFVVLPLAEDSLFYLLQSVQTPELAFVVANPFLFFTDYDFEIDKGYLEKLGIESEKDVAVYSILMIKDPMEHSTANLQAPVIVNTKNNKGKQIILTNTNYQTKHKLYKQPVK
ncbi:flagellar assembly protein FliW [Metabacillus iocasae]|uniref:Flagellar assembly factor FliW n=1 Tax=Priestia iocasae TaxID=2291674 RepID=A0ABS2QZM7_9BACI|nr:flagellar assembly protein FliW [Metabacillus iocasae]MBM7704467.1 flagellar assembly factor FliW [Metabacillus iocasae]